jgi:PAS domain S-box-containing protein
MEQKWTKLKNIISSNEEKKGIFLSLLDERGMIICANATMIKSLNLKNPRETQTSFFDLLHPVNLDAFKSVLKDCGEKGSSFNTELYIKNGHYHPMKWQVNYLGGFEGKGEQYLCVGHKLLDNDRMEEFTKLGEKNYQLIVEGLSGGMLFQDNTGEIISTNYKTAAIFDTTLENLYQLKDIRSLWDNNWSVTNISNEKVSFEETPFMQALKTSTIQNTVLGIKLRSGAQKWISFSSQPFFEENSQVPLAVVSSIVDVTKERELSSKLEERNALFDVFMKQTPNLAWVVDEDANLVFASQSFYSYFGLEEEKTKGKNIIELVPAEVADSLYEKHIRVLQTGEPADMIEKVQWANGKNFIFHINIFPISNSAGDKKMLAGHAVNLAEKHAVQKQLKEANEKLLLLTRATSDAIWEWDMQTGHIFRNDALMDMIGYQLEDPKGLSWWLRRIHPDDRNRVSDKVKDSTDKNLQSWEDGYRFKCADGSYKHMRDKGYIVYENGLPVKMIGSLQDVSNMKDLENQLVEEKLERQKEISETVMRVQEKERTRIGHELHDNVNQILSTTKLFIDMLTPVGKNQQEMKAKSIEYILMAIEEIRKLSKELVVPQLHNKGLVESINSLINDIHETTAIRIKFTHDQENDLLSPGKKVTLFRIVQEQLKNILKHSHATQVDIFLQCKDNEAQLVIKDNGCGFDSAQTHRGIGLSNIYERTRFYSGTANIQSSKGNGCILEILIPAF